MRYDCEKATEMAMHSRFHFIITSLLLQWKNIGFETNSPALKLLSPCLAQIKDNYDKLSNIAKRYFTENLESFQIGGQVPFKDPKFNFLTNKLKEDILEEKMEF